MELKRKIYDKLLEWKEKYSKDNEIVSTLLRQISWSNNIAILSGTKTMEEKEFYIRMCIKNNYSARELNRQLSSGYFYRYMLSKDNNALRKIMIISVSIYLYKVNPISFPILLGPTYGVQFIKQVQF